MKKFYFIDTDYQNDSLNSLARRVTEYNTAELVSHGDEVAVVASPIPNTEYQETGKLSLRAEVPFTVRDLHIINDLFNYNLYFVKNRDDRFAVPKDLKGSFDCLVSLAAGNMIDTNVEDIGFTNGNHYVVDISPTAIHQSMGIYKETRCEFRQLDIFNAESLKEFLDSCVGTKGFFVVSNCFMYIVNALLYDVTLRLEAQNKFIKILSEDKIDWYVNILTADGIYYQCVRAKDIVDKKLDDRFKALPWIK